MSRDYGFFFLFFFLLNTRRSNTKIDHELYPRRTSDNVINITDTVHETCKYPMTTVTCRYTSEPVEAERSGHTCVCDDRKNDWSTGVLFKFSAHVWWGGRGEEKHAFGCYKRRPRSFSPLTKSKRNSFSVVGAAHAVAIKTCLDFLVSRKKNRRTSYTSYTHVCIYICIYIFK